MAPIEINEGMFQLLEGESVTGVGGDNKPLTFKGPMVIRVSYFDDLKLMSIQGGESQIEVDGLDFPKVVTREKK